MWGLLVAVKFMCMLCGSPFVFLCVDLQLQMYEIGVPRVARLCFILGAV